jgi:RimJ/RimL family protein N-acetyltransferase
MKDRPNLETERLILRRPEMGDIPAIIAIAGDIEVSRRLARVPHPYGEADAQFFLSEIVPNEWTWGITLRPSGTVIGMVGLSPQAEPNTAELGYYVDHRHWGQGIATEAARAVLDYGLTVLKLSRITSGHFLSNPASGRVLTKLGFVAIGQDERHCLATGITEPSASMVLQPLRSPVALPSRT